MAATYVTHVGFGHTVDELAYAGSGSVTGWTLNAGTPNYIEADDTAGGIGLNTTNSFTPLTNVWISCSLLRHVGQIATNARIHILRFSANLGSNVVEVSLNQSTDNDHFVIRLTEELSSSIIGTGSVEIAVDTDFTLLIWQNGSTVQVKVNGTEDDINVSHGGKIDRTGIQGLPTGSPHPIGSGDKVRIGPIAIHHSDDSADRPGVDVGDQVVYPDGNKEQSYGDDADCSAGSTSGAYTDVDDWVSGTADDATTYICESGNSPDYFMATMSTVTVSNNFTGGRLIFRNRANVAGKTVNWQYVIRDNDGTPNEIKKSGQNLGTTTWTTRSIEFPTAPDAGPWSQNELDNLNCGVLRALSNGANDEHTAFMFEPCTIDADPPAPPATGRRRAAAQVF